MPEGEYPKSSGLELYLYDKNSTASVKRGQNLRGLDQTHLLLRDKLGRCSSRLLVSTRGTVAGCTKLIVFI